MSKANKCRKCGKWYYPPEGLISIPQPYDSSLCKECNRGILKESEGQDDNK